MKRNRKRLSIIVASFIAILAVGTAFAWQARGPLLFNGTVNVDAELMVVIDSAAHPNTGTHLYYDWNLVYSDHVRGVYYKTVDITVYLHGDGTPVVIPFDVKNIGTVTAGVNVGHWGTTNGMPPGVILTTTHNWPSTSPLIMAPGAVQPFEFTIDFDATNFGGYHLTGYHTFTLRLEYTRFR